MSYDNRNLDGGDYKKQEIVKNVITI